MKFHAKWSTLSFLAATAFGMGAAVYTGCTVTSGEIDDFDGGTGTTIDSGTASDAGDAGTAADAAPIGTVCSGLQQKAQLIDDACQLCLETTCCGQLKGCYNVTPGDGTVNCDDYAACVDENSCELDPAKPSSDTDAGALLCDGCRSAADPKVPPAFNEIFTCASQNCKAACKIP